MRALSSTTLLRFQRPSASRVHAPPPSAATQAKLLRLVSSEKLSKMGTMVREESAARAAPGRECQEAVAELMGLGGLPCDGEQLSMGASASLTLRVSSLEVMDG